MRLIGGILLVILAGCAGSPTLEELEDEAIVSGDWSAVEEREELLKRKGKNVLQCPSGFVSSCYEVGLRVDCKCVRAYAGRRMLP